MKQRPLLKTLPMLVGTAWLASLALVYLLASGGESAKSPGHVSGSDLAAGIVPGSGGNPAARDRALRRGLDELPELDEKEKAEVRQKLAETRTWFGRGFMDFRGMQRWMAPLANLKPAQIMEALAEMERTVQDPWQQATLYKLLLGQLAETDGRAALAFLQEKVPRDDYSVRSAVLRSWSRQDPEAAWRWLQTEGQGVSQEETIMLLVGTADHDLDAVFPHLADVPSSTALLAARQIASDLGADSIGRMLERTEAIPSEQRRSIREALFPKWAQRKPEAALAWLRALPEEEQRTLRPVAAAALLPIKPAEAAELYLQDLPESDRSGTYARIVTDWAVQDPQAAADWLAKRSQGPELDNARSAYAQSVAARDPAAAMAWAKSVQQAPLRTAAVSAVYQIWSFKDTAAAEAALQASGLPKEEIRKLKEQPRWEPEPLILNWQRFSSATP